jgi:hypothetical protein
VFLVVLSVLLITALTAALVGWKLRYSQGLTREAGLALGAKLTPELDGLGLSDDVREALLNARLSGSQRSRIAARNLLVLEVDEKLQRGSGFSRLAWRVAAAATLAGVLVVSRAAPQLAMLLAGLGGIFSFLSYFLGRMADRENHTARERWNALIRVLGGSFTNG